jgi:alanyl-tRNA synthetase
MPINFSPSLKFYSLSNSLFIGGKHNDLDDVGKDVYHHTFFEMLGNWSFGDYFKEDAISWAWECLTVVFGIDPSRLYATYFGGDESQGLAADLEARDIWLRFLPAERVLPCGCKENFWEMGATGPCGPCTEIHYDRIGSRDAAHLVNADVPDVIEIWNNVFIQFNREADGSLRELPSKHVDTGMGLERLTSVLQNKSSNYDTDIFMPIFEAIQAATGAEPYGGLVGSDDVTLRDTAYRVVADHIRTLTFAITDGAVPSNDGRGYVLKRIVRRAIRYGHEILGGPEGFFSSLVSVVVKNFSDAFPELLQRQDFVRAIITEEEKSFSRTLAQGVRYFNKLVVSLKAANETVVPAKEAHTLFSSMGFPLDLTELMAAEHKMTVDKAGFNDLMEKDRKISEAAENARKGGSGKDMSMEAEQTAWLQNQSVPVTDNISKYSWNIELSAEIVALYLGRGGEGSGFIDEIHPDNGIIGIILNTTSFYYESGGQIYDTGRIVTDSGDEFVVTNVQSYAGYVVHVGFLVKGHLRVKQSARCFVDYDRRGFIAPNHTMTHALNHALRSVLIPTDDPNPDKYFGLCEQKGSLVDNERLRFDFSWISPLTNDQLAAVERKVNELIQSQHVVYSDVVPLAEAKNIPGLRQVFGEKYPDPVRVISIGVSVSNLLSDAKQLYDISVEFCGGTHLSNTKEAEDLVIVEESGISKGVRRIIAITRAEAIAARDRAEKLSKKLSGIERLPGGNELSDAMKRIKLEVIYAILNRLKQNLTCCLNISRSIKLTFPSSAKKSFVNVSQ